jgi:predicted amidohydrolase
MNRREFLGAAAVAPAAAGEAGLRSSRGIFPQQTLLERRAENLKADIRGRIAKGTALPVTVAVVQMRNHCGGAEGKRANLHRVESAIRAAASDGAQVVVFPEMCLPGYFTGLSGTVEQAVEANRELADTPGESPSLAAVAAAARENKAVVAFGFGERQGRDVYDSVGLIDSDGTWLGVRRKNPLYPWKYEGMCFREPPAGERTTVFRTRYATVGLLCCFDGEFPESVRRMRMAGAELLLWSNAALGDSELGSINRIVLAGAHAAANHMWVACANCVAENSSGTSLICGPYGDPLTILSPAEESVGVATIDLSLSRDWSIWRDRIEPAEQGR